MRIEPNILLLITFLPALGGLLMLASAREKRKSPALERTGNQPYPAGVDSLVVVCF